MTDMPISRLDKADLATFAKRLEWARKRQKLTQTQLADAMEVTRGTVANWEAVDGNKPPADKFIQLGARLDISAGWLLTGDGRPERAGADVSQGLRTVPRIRLCEAQAYLDTASTEGLELVGVLGIECERPFAVVINDDSMMDPSTKAGFPIESLAFIDPDAPPTWGNIVIVAAGDETQLRQYEYLNGRPTLKAWNPQHATRPLSESDRILGVVIRHTQNFV